MTLKLFLNIY